MANRDIERIIADLGKIPKELRREARPAIKRAAEPIAADARRRASWSKRIPKAIRISPRLSRKQQGVAIRVDSKKAPHARAYEGISGRGDTFRHPVHGNREKWVEQKTRPFLAPAAKGRTSDVRKAVDGAIADAARKTGWR